MVARLRRGVVVGGVRYAEGTEETEQLRAAIPNPGAWTGDSDFAEPSTSELGVTVTSPSAEDIAAAVQQVAESFRAELKAELLEELTEELRKLVEQIPLAVLGEVDSPELAAGAGGVAPEMVEPPRGGKGATEPAWRAYAEHLGVDVTGVADRDGIVALVDQHKAASL